MKGSKEDWLREYDAPEGGTWVCGACGRYGQNRVTLGDEACFSNAILCETSSLGMGKWGRVEHADAMEGGE